RPVQVGLQRGRGRCAGLAHQAGGIAPALGVPAPLHRGTAASVGRCPPWRPFQTVRPQIGRHDTGAEHCPAADSGRQAVRPLLNPAGRRLALPSPDQEPPMSVNFGTKRIVVGAHYGLRDWLAQRITAGLMALFTLLVLAQVVFTRGPIGYDTWAGIFAAQWMKVLTFVVIVALLYHAWVGVRDILMDYIKPFALRLALQIFSIVWLLGCAGWAIQVLWRL